MFIFNSDRYLLIKYQPLGGFSYENSASNIKIGWNK